MLNITSTLEFGFNFVSVSLPFIGLNALGRTRFSNLGRSASQRGISGNGLRSTASSVSSLQLLKPSGLSPDIALRLPSETASSPLREHAGPGGHKRIKIESNSTQQETEPWVISGNNLELTEEGEATETGLTGRRVVIGIYPGFPTSPRTSTFAKATPDR
jgi:hypothetical protein